MGEIGEVETIPCEVKQIEWRISDIYALAEDRGDDYYTSPPFSFVKEFGYYLSLWPNWGNENEEFVELFLRNDKECEHPVKYEFGLKKRDGSVKQLINGEKKKKQHADALYSRLIKKTELLRRKSELMPGNVLTIICTLTINFINSFQSTTVVEKTKRQKLIRLDKLSENFKYLLGDKETCDTILKVKGKEFSAHRSVLIARSSVFAATFKHDTLEKQTGIITITDCDPESFQEFLEYLYCGQLEELSFPSALNLYYTSDKYDVEEVKAYCIEYLMHCLTVENICEIVVFAGKHEEAALFTAVQFFFNKNVSKILTTSGWDCLLIKDRRLANKLLIEMSKVNLNE